MGFIQIIEFETDKIDELKKLSDEFSEDMGSTQRVNVGEDRDNPGHYYVIAEFGSYEEAMENSNRPETSKFAAEMAALCKGAPAFRNIDVRWTE